MAAVAVIALVWRRFLTMYPEVRIEFGVDEARIDIVVQGLRRRHWAAQPRGSGHDRRSGDGDNEGGPWLARLNTSRKHSPPDDLARHSCVQYRLTVRTTA